MVGGAETLVLPRKFALQSLQPSTYTVAPVAMTPPRLYYLQAFDVYAPNARFSRKKCPPPQARVFVLRPRREFLSLDELHAAESMSAGVSVKFASVQHGEVQFFSMNLLSLPSLK